MEILFLLFSEPVPARAPSRRADAARVNERAKPESSGSVNGDPSLARAHRVSSIVVIVVRLEIFALSKSARFFFGYWSDRAGRAL